jgi:hypothetical protein
LLHLFRVARIPESPFPQCLTGGADPAAGEFEMIQLMYPNCAGLDVHKKFAVACRLTVDLQGVVHQELRTFSTMTGDLQVMSTWLREG